MIYNELFWYKYRAEYKFHYVSGVDDVVNITDKDIDISGLGNSSYHTPDKDLSNGKLDAAISAQNQALQAAANAEKNREDAQKVANKMREEAAKAGEKVNAAQEWYEKVNSSTSNTVPEGSSWGSGPGDAKGGTESINIAGVVAGGRNLAKGLSQLNKVLEDMILSANPAGNPSLLNAGAVAIQGIVDTAKSLISIIAGQADDKGTGDSNVIKPGEPSGKDYAEQLMKDAATKSLNEAVQELLKTIDALNDAKAKLEIAIKEEELAKQKADEATKALEALLAGGTVDTENTDPEVAEIVGDLTKKDLYESPNFIETGSVGKEVVVPDYDIGKYVHRVTYLQNYKYPEHTETYSFYFDLYEVTREIIPV